ncbi:MAG TPA: copper-containing nitrite reductase [Dongiaceae bacterium]
MRNNPRSCLRATASLLALSLVLGAGLGLAASATSAVADGDGHGGAMAPHVQMEGIADIVRAPTDLPPPIGKRGPEHVRVDFETTEVAGQLDDGTSYRYWTFGGKVPGPFVRVRVGDTVEVHLKNAGDSAMMHNIDLHAVTGPGGGGVATEAAPGEEKGFVFKAINPGLYVYHCATPPVAQHISAGMYGLILVEPEGGLPKVDREFYVMQGELYTEEAIGAKGELTESWDKLLAERPEFFVFNGAVGALANQKPLAAEVGETIRIYFGDGGPNATSSFHMIGEIFDKVYSLGDLTSQPLTNVQTATVPPGGAVAVDVKLDVPGRFLLVDHALSRMEKGLMAIVNVEGEPNPEIFKTLNPDKSAAN